MGFIKAFAGAISGAFADQWKDFYMPIPNVSATAAIFPAIPQGTNVNRGENTKGSENIITNGSKNSVYSLRCCRCRYLGICLHPNGGDHDC